MIPRVRMARKRLGIARERGGYQALAPLPRLAFTGKPSLP